MIERFKADGRVLNTFLDELGIVADPEATDRDELTLCRQDCQLITHVDTVTRYRDKHTPIMALYTPPVLTSANSATGLPVKEFQDAQKLVMAAQKKQATKKATADRKAQEKSNRDAMTPDERKQDTEKRRQIAADKKVAKSALAAEEAVKVASALAKITGQQP